MKKLLCLALALLLTFALPGCAGLAQTTDAEVDAQIPPELDYANNPELAAQLGVDQWDDDELGEDAEDDDFDEEYDYDVPRSIVPATDADQIQGAPQVDFKISDTQFVGQIDEMATYSDEYLGKTFSLIGYVLYNKDYPPAPFAIVRDYIEPDHDHDGDGQPDHETSEDDEPYQMGIDCAYEGTLPAENSWVRAVGVLAEYHYTDEDGEGYDALKFEIKYIQAVPETEGGSRTVTG